MTGHQKEHITAMRMQGIGYSTIGKSLGLKKETVAAFCRKNGLNGVKATDKRVTPSQTDTCPVCGTVLMQIPDRKKCRFCSETAAGNTVPFPAPPSKGGIYRERLEHYLSARLCVKRMHSLWLSSTSLHQLYPIFPRKLATTSSSIYRHNGLLSAVEYGNMSDTKEATA